jgi:hypothetical protein
VADTCAVTGFVVTVKVALVVPAATVSDDGTVTAAVLLVRATTSPALGAGPDSETVPVAVFPPRTEDDESETAESAAGETVRVAVFVVPPKVADNVVVVVAAISPVVNVAFALVAPAATVKVAGTGARVRFELERLTDTPPLGAVALRFTVSVTVLPLTTELGLSETPEAASGTRVICAVLLTPPKVAVMVAAVEAVTPVAPIEKVAEVLPAGMVMDAGSEAAPTLLLKETDAPRSKAGPFKFTVPVAA